MASFLDWLEDARFGLEKLRRYRTARANGAPVFSADFLEWLARSGTFEGVKIRAIPEGRVVHPNEPLTVVQGPAAMAQILETALLNFLNYQTLIATKAPRLKESGRGSTAPGIWDASRPGTCRTAATRAALIGGADWSSNVGSSQVLGFHRAARMRTAWYSCLWRLGAAN